MRDRTPGVAACALGIRPLLQVLYVASAMHVFTQVDATFQCPSRHYPYGGCSSCFTVIDQTLSFDSARQECVRLGGTLITTESEQQFRLLSRYLGGLQEKRTLWIGYRLSSSGSRIGLEGDGAPSVILDNNNFNGSTSGNGDSCVGIQSDKFVVVPCAQTLPSICTITYDAPTAVKTPNDDIVYAALDNTINLQASVTVTGIKFVEWKFNGTGIRQDENGISVTTSGETPTGIVATLKISSYTSSTHLGLYELLVTSQAGTAIVTSWILRNAELQFTAEPDNVTVPEGQLAAFECATANAKPKAQVQWYKGSALLANATDQRVYISSLTGTLIIREVLASDAGLYQCQVTNTARSITSRQGRLTVQALSTNPVQVVMPHFILRPRDWTVLTGQSYSIECVGIQTRTSYATTTFHGEQGLGDSFMVFTYPNNSGYPVYTVNEATLDEQDCYFCAIMALPFDPAIASFSFTSKAYITVHASAVVESFSTIWNGTKTSGTSQSIPVGDASVLECEYSGVPSPNTVVWTRDGAGITNGIVNNVGASNLNIARNNASSIYQCHVENQYRRDTRTVFVCAKEEQDGVPEPVVFTALPDTNTTLYVQWDQATPISTHPLLLRYEVLFSDGVSSNLTFGPFLSTQLNYTITDLEPNTEYVVSVVATTLQGRSDVNASLSVSTFPNPPSEPVENVTVERNDNNTILIVQWDLYRSSDGKAVTMATTYEIEYRVSSTSGSGGNSKVEVVNGNNTIAIIPSLNNAASYEVRIRVRVQTSRDPRQFVSSEWSEFIQVHGITTLPTTPTPALTDGVSVAPRGLTTTGLLLLVIFLCLVAILLVVVVTAGIVCVVCCLKKRAGRKYTVRHSVDIREERRNNNSKGGCTQTPMRDEVFALQGSLPTSPSPPPVLDTSRHSGTFLEATEREPLNNQVENGVCVGSLTNQSNLSSPRSVSPLPLPPPNPDFDTPYTSTVRSNVYIMAPFSVNNPSSNQFVPSSDQLPPPPPIGYTDEVHDISSGDFKKLDISQDIFDMGSPEVFDRLEGFEPVQTFDIITTRGEEGSYDTLPRDSLESREYSPATTTSLINPTPEPMADHRVTFAPAIVAISPVPFTEEEISRPGAVVMQGLNSSNCNNNVSMTTTTTTSRGGINISHLPPVAEIVEGEELSEQLEPFTTVTV